MKLIFDFDRTLFDVEKLYQLLREQDAMDLAGTAKSFEIVDFAELLFPDVVSFLESHKKEDLFILSSHSGTTANWGREYQEQKIIKTGIDQLVEKVVVMFGDKAGYVKELVGNFSDERVLFIDDQITHCQSVKESVPTVECMLMKREHTPQEEGDFQDGFRIINKLSDAIV